MPSKTASTAAASSAKKQTRLRRLRNQINPLFRRPFNYFHEQIMSSKSTSAAANEYFIYMGRGTVPENVTHVIVHESVTVIPDNAFRFCRDLKEVILPEGLLEIGQYAFSFCTSLKDINFPSTLRVIGEQAFCGCSSLVRVDFNEGLQTIGDYAFGGGCRSILHLKIPSSVTTIGNGAFWCCCALKDVQLCEGLLSIGASAFRSCYSLLSINIPSSVTIIGREAFDDCNFLRNVAIAPDSNLEQAELEQSHLLNNLQQVGCSLDSVKGRFDDLPLHRICFFETESATLLEEVREHAIMDRLTQQDCLGMTPLHILACSGRHDIEVYKLFVDIHPEALLIEDRWGETLLAYAMLCEAPQEIIQFLFENHKKILTGSLPFDFSTVVEKIAKKEGTNAEFVHNLIQAQRTHFPTLEIEWGRIVNENVEGSMHVKVFRVLVEASVSRRLNCMSLDHQLAIDDLVNEVDSWERRRVDGQRIIDRIQDYAQHYREWLENVTTVLELALWNSADNATRRGRVHRHKEGANVDDLGPREESRVNCGAGVIIPLVLLFL